MCGVFFIGFNFGKNYAFGRRHSNFFGRRQVMQVNSFAMKEILIVEIIKCITGVSCFSSGVRLAP